MRLNAEKIDVESSGFVATEFGVNIKDPAVIQILTQGIYNDPWIWPRELLANAADAGGAVSLILPDSLTPEWIVEDHGAGMTDEFMATRYTMIFDSTKRDDDSKTGGFGHGRLSPLAYTDSYNVRSRFEHEGKIMEGNYIVFKGENKIPQITRISLGISDVQQTGVTVTVPVATKDISKIAGRTRYYAAYSVPTPPEMKAVEYIFRGTTGGIRKNDDNLMENQGVRVIMGGVPYPAPANIFNNSTRVDLYIEVGDADPTLSRDALKNSDKTTKLLRDKMNVLTTEFQKSFEEQINAQPTMLEKYIKYKELHDGVDWWIQTTFLRGIKTATEIESSVVLKALKKDFAIHTIHSDTGRREWAGMDEVTKSFKSLSMLKVFQLTGQGKIYRRDGHEISEGQINFSDYILTGKPTVLNTIMFAVPLPYTTGQIKRIREAMAKVLGDARTAGTLGNRTLVTLIQYEDKQDVEAFTNLLSDKIVVNYIDQNTVGAKANKYVPCMVSMSGSVKTVRKAINQTALAAMPDTLFIVKDNLNDWKTQEYIQYLRSSSISTSVLSTKNLVVVTKASEKLLPAGWQGPSDLILKAIASDYGYPYDSTALNKLMSAHKTSNTVSDLRILDTKFERGKPLWQTLMERSEIQKLPDVMQIMEFAKARINKNDPIGSEFENLTAKLREIDHLIAAGVITKDELPAPTKVFPIPTQGNEALVTAFNKKYMLLTTLGSSYGYYTRPEELPTGLLDHVVEYIVKFN